MNALNIEIWEDINFFTPCIYMLWSKVRAGQNLVAVINFNYKNTMGY